LQTILAADPLGILARKERRALLIMSVIAFAIVKAGLVPTEISVFGIKAEAINPPAIFWLIALVVLYFLVSFLLHAFPDFFAWWARYNKWRHEQNVEAWQYEAEFGSEIHESDPGQPSEEFMKSFQKYANPHRMSMRMVLVRAFSLDLIIPYVVGVIALFFTVTAALT